MKVINPYTVSGLKEHKECPYKLIGCYSNARRKNIPPAHWTPASLMMIRLRVCLIHYSAFSVVFCDNYSCNPNGY